MAVLSTVGLVVDWKRRKHCYTHITKPEAMIRSETAEQMAKRIQRQSSQGKVYVIASPNGEGPPRPEAPNRGLVQQMKDKIERNI